MIIDTHVNLSRWPFRRLPGDRLPDLVSKLKEHGVSQAWAGSFDGLLHKDVRSVNARLTTQCRALGRGLLQPFGSVNPTLPDWKEDLRQCAEDHLMPGIRLHPNYHGYTLETPEFGELLHLAAQKKLVVQIVLQMEDERTQHPLLRVPPVETGPLLEKMGSLSGPRVVILNHRDLEPERLHELTSSGDVYLDFAMVEGAGGVSQLLEDMPAERVVLGSHFPFYHFEAALLKVKEGGISEEKEELIFANNAQHLLG